MTSRPSSPRIPAPSVLEIDRSKYPFSSPRFKPEMTNGLRIQDMLGRGFKWSRRSELSYFEVVGGKGDVYERLDVGDHGVAQFIHDTQRSPDLRIFFVSAEVCYGGPLSLTREAFIELLEKTGVPPTFIEIYISVSGALVGSPVYSDGNQEKPVAYEIFVNVFTSNIGTTVIYFRHDFSTRRTTCLAFGKDLYRLQNRFQQLFPRVPSTGTARPQQYPRDPFLVLSIIAAEFVFAMGETRTELVAELIEQQKETGVTGHLYDRSLRVSPSALPSRIKGLHICNLHLGYLMSALESQISWVAFLQRQHQIFNKSKTKVIIDGADGDEHRRMKEESTASRKVPVSLDLSASVLHYLLFNVRIMSREAETNISIVQSIISQFDSRTNISIAHDLKKDSVAMKTVAGLTMVFLPGTFTATFFSMVFFHVTDNPEPRLTVNKHWWLYVAVTVPLTGLVLAVWLGWMRWKRRGMPKDVELEDLGEE